MLDKMVVNTVCMIGMQNEKHDFISNAKDKSKPIIVAVYNCVISTVIMIFLITRKL